MVFYILLYLMYQIDVQNMKWDHMSLLSSFYTHIQCHPGTSEEDVLCDTLTLIADASQIDHLQMSPDYTGCG